MAEMFPTITLDNIKTTLVMYVDVEGENVESLWGTCMPLDRVDEVWGRTLCSPLCTYGPALPRSLTEDLKFYEQKLRNVPDK